jgi:hypothetical protein
VTVIHDATNVDRRPDGPATHDDVNIRTAGLSRFDDIDDIGHRPDINARADRSEPAHGHWRQGRAHPR